MIKELIIIAVLYLAAFIITKITNLSTKIGCFFGVVALILWGAVAVLSIKFAIHFIIVINKLW